MNNRPLPCPYCRTVNTLCFWGPRPQARWKRPALGLTSLLINIGLLVLFIMLTAGWSTDSMMFLFLLLAVLFWLASCLGVAVALFACDACVARLWGNV